MIAHDRWLRTAALLVVVAMPTALGACCLAEGDWYRWLAVYLFQGPLVLIALWSALSNTPVYIRWPCGYLVLWAACPLLAPAFAVHAYFWVLSMDWEAPHILLTFTLLCVLRELGLRVQRPTDVSSGTTGDERWRFTLRRLFAWITAAAVLSLVWTRAFAMVRGEAAVVGEINFPTLVVPWRVVAGGTISGFSLTSLDLMAVWAVLQPGRVRWRIALLALVVVLSQTLVWQYAVRAPLGLSLRLDALHADANRMHMYAQCCLCPILLALFLVRWGGYRWTASRSLSPQHPR